MAVIYAQETPLDRLDPVELSIELDEAIAEAIPWLSALSNERAGLPPAEGMWCPKEIIGHLIDSAINNLDRIVRLETVLDIEPEVRSPGYEQEAWIDAQRYAGRDWPTILELWRALNEHIAWTMRNVSRHKLGRICVFPDHQMTFGFVLEDYLGHLRHHLTALHAQAVNTAPSGV